MDLLYKDITGRVVDCAVMVHKELGPGLLVSSACTYCTIDDLFEIVRL